MNIKYIRPTSMSWWAGAGFLIMGVLDLFGINFAGAPLVHTVIEQIAEAEGIAMPEVAGTAIQIGIGKIVAGLGIIGLRDKMERLQGIY